MRFRYLGILSVPKYSFDVKAVEGNMSYQCEVCGCVYQWEMFFHNHIRTVHGISIKRSKRTYLGERNITFLENYFCNICEKPSLGEIENLAGVMEVKKETIYWWFVNRNKRQRKSIKRKSMLDKSSLKQDVDVKGCVD